MSLKRLSKLFIKCAPNIRKMKNFTNLKDISAKNLRKILVDAKKRKIKGLGEKGIVLPANFGFSEKEHVRPNFKRSNFMEVNLKLLSSNDSDQ